MQAHLVGCCCCDWLTARISLTLSRNANAYISCIDSNLFAKVRGQEKTTLYRFSFPFSPFPQWGGLDCHFGWYFTQWRHISTPSQCRRASFSGKVLWAFRVCTNAGQFSQWLPKDFRVPGSPFLSGASASNFLQCCRDLQQHIPIMAKKQSTKSKTGSTVLPLYKHRN